MRTLYHLPLDPACRAVRLVLAEKGLVCQFTVLKPWDDPDDEISKANHAGTLPVLLDEPPIGGVVQAAPLWVILEYLEDAYPQPPLFPSTSAGRAESRRLCAWFSDKFEREVVDLTYREKIERRQRRLGQPDYENLKAGGSALVWHLDYFAWLLDQRTWFTGEQMSVTDLVAAGYFSTIDYLDLVPWDKFPVVKEWYARMKSRPSMRPVLRDRYEGAPPPRHYEDPDF